VDERTAEKVELARLVNAKVLEHLRQHQEKRENHAAWRESASGRKTAGEKRSGRKEHKNLRIDRREPNS